MQTSLRRRVRGLGLFLLIGVSVAACGDDDDDDGGGGTSAGAATAATTAGAATSAPAATVGDDTAATSATGATTGDTEDAGTTAAAVEGTSLDELYAAAQEEPQLVVYSSQAPDPLAKIAADFEAKYPGIDVEAVRGVDGDLSSRSRPSSRPARASPTCTSPRA